MIQAESHSSEPQRDAAFDQAMFNIGFKLKPLLRAIHGGGEDSEGQHTVGT